MSDTRTDPRTDLRADARIDTPLDTTRAFEMTLDVAATPDDVWRALTDASEITRWFSPVAAVVPGVGGSVTWTWEHAGDWRTRIAAWEPGRRLRLVQDDALPVGADGQPLAGAGAEPARVAIEFTIATDRGATRLRIVHSGFGTGAAWDDELEGITEGWQAELRSLRHYLERHRGRERAFGAVTRVTPLARDAAWARLVGPDGFVLAPPSAREGDAYALATPWGDRLTGEVVLHLPRQTVAGTVRELHDGWVRLLTWSIPDGTTGVWAGLATWDGDTAAVERFRTNAESTLARLFA